jgi:hypothetical protein
MDKLKSDNALRRKEREMKKAIKILGCVAGTLLAIEGLMEIVSAWLWHD